MKKILLYIILLISIGQLSAQPGKKTAEKPPATEPDLNKLLEEAMNNEKMSEEEKEEMRKNMKNLKPVLEEHNKKTADYPEFNTNKELIPRKDPNRIIAMAKKALAKTEIAGYANGLYSKMMAKINPEEMALVKKVIAQNPKAADIGSAALFAMLQGHPEAAMALAIKAVVSDPLNPNWQNNMAALLTGYGYPEQAMPVLKKLQTEFPGNSTVLNNIGQAWMKLGEADSASRFFKAALALNPNHTEAKKGEGLIEELKGDPVKAIKRYAEEMENTATTFTDRLLKNSKGNKYTNVLDFDKIIKNIAVFEYYPENWIKIPLLTPDVNSYSENLPLQKAYMRMIDSLVKDAHSMADEAGKDLNNISPVDEEKYATELMKEAMKGLNMMSKPASIVVGLLTQASLKWSKKYADEVILLETKISYYKDIYKQATKGLKGTECKKYDIAANNLMESVNPMVYKFYLEKAEEYRQWLNAMLTWSWYATGNIKNITLTQCIQSVEFLAQLYEQAIRWQIVRNSSCNPSPEPEEKEVEKVPIPNFTCPVVVSIPAGKEWIELISSSKNFDDNLFNIKANHQQAVPNQTVAYGIDENEVAEPGMEPYSSYSEGSITPVTSGPSYNAGRELFQLMSKYQDNLSIYFKMPASSVPGGNPLEAATNSIRQEMTEIIEAEWKLEEAKKEFWQTWEEMRKKRIEEAKAQQARTNEKSLENLKNFLKMKMEWAKKDFERELENWKKDLERRSRNSETARELLKKMMSANCNTVKDKRQISREKLLKAIDEMEADPEMNKLSLEKIRHAGLQPSLSCGLQPPGTFILSKELFK